MLGKRPITAELAKDNELIAKLTKASDDFQTNRIADRITDTIKNAIDKRKK